MKGDRQSLADIITLDCAICAATHLFTMAIRGGQSRDSQPATTLVNGTLVCAYHASELVLHLLGRALPELRFVEDQRSEALSAALRPASTS